MQREKQYILFNKIRSIQELLPEIMTSDNPGVTGHNDQLASWQ